MSKERTAITVKRDLGFAISAAAQLNQLWESNLLSDTVNKALCRCGMARSGHVLLKLPKQRKRKSCTLNNIIALKVVALTVSITIRAGVNASVIIGAQSRKHARLKTY